MTDDMSKSPSTTLALKLCRLLIFALIALLAATTVYVVALGGVASGDDRTRIIETRVVKDGPGARTRLALPDLDGKLPAGADMRSVIVKCTNDNGQQNCQTTNVPPGKAAPKTPATKGADNSKSAVPGATAEQRIIVECREENGQRHCTTTNGGTPGTGPGQKIETDKHVDLRGPGDAQVVLDDPHGGPGNVEIETENVNSSGAAPSPWHTAFNGTLAGISLALLLVALFNLERLFAAVEGASLFSLAAVRRLQWIGAALLASAVLPHFELPAMIENAATALSLGQKPWPATVLFSLEFNLMLLVAGLFLILMARVVEEGVWLHDEMRGTV